MFKLMRIDKITIYIITSFITSLLIRYLSYSPYMSVLLLLIQNVLFIDFFKRRTIDFSYLLSGFFLAYFFLQNIVLEQDILALLQSLIFLLLHFHLFRTFTTHNIDYNKLIKNQNVILLISILLLFPFHLSWGDYRLGGLFHNPNSTASFALFYYCFGCLILSDKRKKILFYIISVVLLLTASRGPLLSFILGNSAMFLVKRFRISYFGLILLLIGVYIVSSNIVNIASSVMNHFPLINTLDTRIIDVSYNGRDVLREYALMDLYKSPWWGQGFSTSLRYEIGDDIVLNTHSSYLDLVLRFGFYGCSLLLTLFLFIVLKISRISNRYFKSIAVMLVSIWISILSSETYAFKFNYFSVYFTIILSLTINLGNRKFVKNKYDSNASN